MNQTSTEAHVYMQYHQGVKVKHSDVNNVIYHRFSHGPVFSRLSGENVNVMLEFVINHAPNIIECKSCALIISTSADFYLKI